MTIDGSVPDPVFHWFLLVRGNSRDPGVVTRLTAPARSDRRTCTT